MMNKIFEFFNKYIVFIFFIFLFLLRLPLIFKGHLFFPDEERYYFSLMSYEQLTHGQLKSAVLIWFSAAARPLFIILGTLLSAIQYIYINNFFPPDITLEKAIHDKFYPIDGHFFDLVSFTNLITTVAISVVFYHICLHFMKKRSYALISTLVYSLLWNSYLYIRHLVPYDYSLLCFMSAVLLMIKFEDKRHFLVIGILAALGIGFYPGYTVFPLVIAAFMMGKIVENKKYFHNFLSFIFGFILILLGLEILSRISGTSYLGDFRAQSSGITMGDPKENFTFFFKCFTQVEGIHGLIIFILFFAGFWFLLKSKSLGSLILSLFAGYIAYAGTGFIFKDPVVYGRLIHMYVPFLVLGAMATLTYLPELPKKIAFVCIAVSSILSFSFTAPKFYSAVYPKEVIYETYKQIKDPLFISFLTEEIQTEACYKALATFRNKPVVLVNAKYYYAIGPYSVKIPGDITGYKMIKSFSHPLNLVPYQFEGLREIQRSAARIRNYQMKVFVKNDNQFSNLFKTKFWE